MTRQLIRRPLAWIVLITASLGLAACYGESAYGDNPAGGAAPTALPPDAPTASADIDESCGSASLWVDYAPVDVKTLVVSGATMQLARVTGSEPAVFNTADGSAPDGFLTKGRSFATVYTPYDVEVDQVFAGEGDAGAGVVLVEGGVVGCIEVTVDGAARLTVGSTYVLTLGTAKDVAGKAMIGPQTVVFAWPLDVSGVVHTPDGAMTTTELGTVVESAKATMR